MSPAKGAFGCDHRLSLPSPAPRPTWLSCRATQGQGRNTNAPCTLLWGPGGIGPLRSGSLYNSYPVACAGKEKASQDVKLPVLCGVDPICVQ